MAAQAHGPLVEVDHSRLSWMMGIL
jgi:hypothetical protein